MRKFLLIFSVMYLLFSCNKPKIEPSYYQIKVKNMYFERIDSLRIDSFALGGLKSRQVSKELILEKGNYSFYCVTKSELRIQADIHIKGINKNLMVIINENAKIEIK